jgi:hypothetical protein
LTGLTGLTGKQQAKVKKTFDRINGKATVTDEEFSLDIDGEVSLCTLRTD